MHDSLDLDNFRQAGRWITLTSDLREGREVDGEHAKAMLSTVRESRLELGVGLAIYRARLMPIEREDDTEPFAPSEMGPPPADLAPAGRLNSKNAPRFYGALDSATAIAECRPWRRARVSVGRFVSSHKLVLADLAREYLTHPLTAEARWLNFILGRPVHRDDTESYLPSQWLANECKREGFDGIIFGSALKPDGANIVLFGTEAITCIDVELHEVTTVAYKAVRLSSWHEQSGG